MQGCLVGAYVVTGEKCKWTAVGPASAVLEYDDAIAEPAGRMASSYMLERGVEGGS